MCKFTYGLLVIFMLTLFVYESCSIPNPPNDNKNECDPSLCARVRCYKVLPEACDPNSERYVKSDGNCYCCDTCIPIE